MFGDIVLEMDAERFEEALENLKKERGVCGEHGGNPESIAFCHEAGLDYVSYSSYRVPVARLAAARAAIGGREKAEV